MLAHSALCRPIHCLQDAEQRAAAASEAAKEANAAAARLLGQRHAQAKGRAADVEAQAKAASLRALVGHRQARYLVAALPRRGRS